MAETSTVEDVFDDTYKEREGPKPPRRLVWRNIILMTLLHVGALYGLVLTPSASGLTLAWGKYSADSVLFSPSSLPVRVRTECADVV